MAAKVAVGHLLSHLQIALTRCHVGSSTTCSDNLIAGKNDAAAAAATSPTKILKQPPFQGIRIPPAAYGENLADSGLRFIP